MARPLLELIQASSDLISELSDIYVTADQIRAERKKRYADWSDDDFADLVMLAAHISRCEAAALETACEPSYRCRATGQALAKFGRRRRDKLERETDKARRQNFFDAIVSGGPSIEEPRRGPGGRHLPSLGLTLDPDQE